MTAFAIYSADDNSLNFYNRDTVPSAGNIFEGLTVTNVYTGFDKEAYSSASFVPWYSNCSNITNVKFIDTILPISTRSLFFGFNNLTSIDLSNLDTSKVVDMSQMFQNCSALTSLDLSNLNTSNVSGMWNMFKECTALTSLDLSNFDTSNVVTMEQMFYNCSALTSLNISNLNTSNVTNMKEMFYGCLSLISLDLNNFNTSNATNMNSMFNMCSNLTFLDLSSFDISKITNMNNMFKGCSTLKTIYVSELWNTPSVTNLIQMFTNCTSLVGGNGTIYDSNYTGGTYARIDTPEAPGYFTYKKYINPKKKDMLVKEALIFELADAIRSKTKNKAKIQGVNFVNEINSIITIDDLPKASEVKF